MQHATPCRRDSETFSKLVMHVMSAQAPSGPTSVFLSLRMLANSADTLKGALWRVWIMTIDSVVSWLHSLQPKLVVDVSFCRVLVQHLCSLSSCHSFAGKLERMPLLSQLQYTLFRKGMPLPDTLLLQLLSLCAAWH